MRGSCPLTALIKIYDELSKKEGGCFITKTLEALDIKYEISAGDIMRIPATGSVRCA